MHNASESIPPAFHAGVGSSRTIDVHVRRIRAALAKKSDYEYVHTVRGLGYRFEPVSAVSASAMRTMEDERG